jgi:hypothetical protein
MEDTLLILRRMPITTHANYDARRMEPRVSLLCGPRRYETRPMRYRELSHAAKISGRSGFWGFFPTVSIRFPLLIRNS